MTANVTNRILITVATGFVSLDIENALERAGYAVVSPALNAAEAIQLLTEEEPDAAIITVGPGDDKFFALLERLRSLIVPFALVGESITEELVADMHAHSLSIPFGEDALLAIVRIMTQQR